MLSRVAKLKSNVKTLQGEKRNLDDQIKNLELQNLQTALFAPPTAQPVAVEKVSLWEKTDLFNPKKNKSFADWHITHILADKQSPATTTAAKNTSLAATQTTWTDYVIMDIPNVDEKDNPTARLEITRVKDESSKASSKTMNIQRAVIVDVNNNEDLSRDVDRYELIRDPKTNGFAMVNGYLKAYKLNGDGKADTSTVYVISRRSIEDQNGKIVFYNWLQFKPFPAKPTPASSSKPDDTTAKVIITAVIKESVRQVADLTGPNPPAVRRVAQNSTNVNKAGLNIRQNLRDFAQNYQQQLTLTV